MTASRKANLLMQDWDDAAPGLSVTESSKDDYRSFFAAAEGGKGVGICKESRAGHSQVTLAENGRRRPLTTLLGAGTEEDNVNTSGTYTCLLSLRCESFLAAGLVLTAGTWERRKRKKRFSELVTESGRRRRETTSLGVGFD